MKKENEFKLEDVTNLRFQPRVLEASTELAAFVRTLILKHQLTCFEIFGILGRLVSLCSDIYLASSQKEN